MGICSSQPISDPFQASEYLEDKKIPFGPEGNSQVIGGCVERVKGLRGQYKGLQAVRKTIFRTAQRYEVADTAWQETTREKLIQEARAIHRARHHHVIHLIHMYFDNQYRNTHEIRFAIIMERADGNLRYYLQPGKQLHERWFGCLIGVVCHLHKLDIRHQNIKPENILIKRGNILLSDFGLAQHGVGEKVRSNFPTWTRDYCAPEVGNGYTYELSADVFSLGAVFLEMLIAWQRCRRAGDLENLLKCPSDGIFSYARNIDRIHLWIKKEFHLLGWQDVIRLKCGEMLRSDQCKRPSAVDLFTFWLSLSTLHDSIACDCAEDAERQMRRERCGHWRIRGLVRGACFRRG